MFLFARFLMQKWRKIRQKWPFWVYSLMLVTYKSLTGTLENWYNFLFLLNFQKKFNLQIWFHLFLRVLPAILCPPSKGINPQNAHFSSFLHQNLAKVSKNREKRYIQQRLKCAGQNTQQLSQCKVLEIEGSDTLRYAMNYLNLNFYKKKFCYKFLNIIELNHRWERH